MSEEQELPSPHNRTISTYRDVSLMDPLKRYYVSRQVSATGDRVSYSLEDQTMRRYRDGQRILTGPAYVPMLPGFEFDNPFKIGNDNLYRCYVATGSEIVNWSAGGYDRRDGGAPGFLPAEQEMADSWNSARSNDGPILSTESQAQRNHNIFRISSSLPEERHQNDDFNFAQEISGLIENSSPNRMDPEDERRYQSTIQRGSRIGDNLLALQIGILGMTPREFYRRYEVDGRSIRTAADVQRIIDAEGSGFNNHLKRQAAFATYTENMYINQTSGSFVDYDFYDFKVDAPFVLDWLSHEANLVGGAQNPPDVRPAFINPEYNYYNGNYERAIANSNIPETVLPNMYVYSLMTSEPFDIGESPAWQTGSGPRRAAELQGDYDKLITLDEFDKNFLPRTNDPDFESYITRYGQAVASGNISVDMYANLNRKNSNTITPAGDMDIYPKFNTAKHAFPMYIEVGMPTNEIGTFGRLAENLGVSAKFMSSLTTTPAVDHSFYFKSNGLLTSVGEGDPFTIDEERDPPQVVSNIFARQETKVYDFNEWFDNIATGAVLATLTERGNDFPEGIDEEACLDYLTQIQVQGMKNAIRQTAKESALTYRKYLYNQNAFAPSETIIFELSKFKLVQGEYVLVQNYFFPNTSFTDVIDYVDTQVKYGQLYRYELKGYAVVYGSKFRFRTYRHYIGSNNGGFTARAGAHLNFSFNVETIPCLKIVEYPIFNRQWQISNGENNLIGGLNYPAIKVLDRPPMPPEVNIFPFKNDYSQVLMNLKAGGGSFMGDRAVPYIPFTAEEEADFSEMSNYQKRVENFSLRRGHLEFRSEGGGEVNRMEIYRTEEVIQNPGSYQDLYRSFQENLHQVLDLDSVDAEGDALPDEDIAKAFDFTDTLLANKKYYYTFRAKDVHENYSNPSIIYQVELLYDKGFYAPRIEVYNPPISSPKSPSKKMARFLEIQAADIQVVPYYEPSDNPIAEANQNQTKGLIASDDNKIQNNDFIVRITSRDTGRKIDLKIKFKVTEDVPVT